MGSKCAPERVGVADRYSTCNVAGSKRRKTERQSYVGYNGRSSLVLDDVFFLLKMGMGCAHGQDA
jgi:hypothetical protein